MSAVYWSSLENQYLADQQHPDKSHNRCHRIYFHRIDVYADRDDCHDPLAVNLLRCVPHIEQRQHAQPTIWPMCELSVGWKMIEKKNEFIRNAIIEDFETAIKEMEL